MRGNIILLIMALFFFSACGSLKKTTSTENVKIETTDHDSGQVSRYVDTTKTEKGDISIIEVEFYPGSAKQDSVDQSPGKIPVIQNGTTKISGSIKSAKITTIKKEAENKGVSKTDSTFNKSSTQNVDKAMSTSKEPAKDPYRWRWILGIIIVVALIGFFICSKVRFKSIWDWIKKILSL